MTEILIKAVVAALIAGGIVWGWNHHEQSLIDKGYAKSQAECATDRKSQEIVDKDFELAEKDRIRAKESLDAITVAAQLNRLEEEKQDAKKHAAELTVQLDNATRRMRAFTGTVIAKTDSSATGTSGNSGTVTETCQARLPVAVGKAAFGIGDEADDTARKLTACVNILRVERGLEPYAN